MEDLVSPAPRRMTVIGFNVRGGISTVVIANTHRANRGPMAQEVKHLRMEISKAENDASQAETSGEKPESRQAKTWYPYNQGSV